MIWFPGTGGSAKRGVEDLKRALETAAELNSTGVIYVPAFKHETKRTNQEIRQLLVDEFPAIGEFAVSVNSRVLLEPLNRGEAFFLRQLADAASICRDINSPGVQMMGDFYHMFIEETSDLGAFISAGDYLHHVHLASRTRVLPGQDERSFVDGFRGLKLIGYQDFCSLECGVKGDREAGKSRNPWACSASNGLRPDAGEQVNLSGALTASWPLVDVRGTLRSFAGD